MANAKFIEANQDWTSESTTYWFELTGTDYGTGYEFDADTFGVVESGSDEPRYVDKDGAPLTDGDLMTIAVANTITVTDQLRAEAAA